MLDISDNDISYAENLILKQGKTFNLERREIIKSLDSIDIIASPGSGKTTTLLAKLAILSTKFPLINNGGICVLTHTNVAIDEVKERLGLFGRNLFSYPNNCSTIQTFVNQFLAIPAYTHFYGKRTVRIDNQIYEEVITKRYFKDIHWRLRSGIERQGINVKTIRYNLSTGKLVRELYGNAIYKNEKSDSYIALSDLKNSVMEDGILCYDDAYYLAFRYLNEKPDLKRIFSNRFRFVFIDEMQDTMDHQKSILELLFDESVIIQRIGDPNQSIYDKHNAKGTWEINEDSYLQIADSKRFSDIIAKTVQNICVNPQELIGNPEIENINPCILVFNSESINQVFPQFSRLLIEKNLHTIDNPIFKAIGWVTDHERELGISDYWKHYKKEVKKKVDFKYLNNYLLKEPNNEVQEYGSNLYRTKILRGLLKALREMGQMNNDKYFTERTLLQYLKENHLQAYDKLLFKLSNWCLRIHNGENILLEVKQIITVDFKHIFGWRNTNDLNVFFENRIDELKEEYQINTNKYKFIEEENVIDLNISSIHSVKGETHTATLYLETYYHDYDIKRIIEYLKGNHSRTSAVRKLQNLKMAYVGMTRASHLLCVAVKNDSIEGHEEELIKAGWDIRHL